MNNGSVYSEDLIKFLRVQDIPFSSFSSLDLDLEILRDFDSVILSGRRYNDAKMNMINSKIIKHCISKDKSLLGICYGIEILALTLGGTIRKTPSLQKGMEEVNIIKSSFVSTFSKKKLHVFESHHFEVFRLPKSMICLGSSKNCRYEIIQLKDRDIYGVQFHPEMSQDGQILVKKFINI